MDLIRKSFKDNTNGETITISDVYKNVAITNTREKIDTHLLLDPRYYTPLDSSTNTPSHTVRVNENRITNNIALTEEIVDPNKFFSPTTTYNAFAEKISTFPLDNIPYDDNIPVVTTSNVNMPTNQNNNPFYPTTNESAVLPYDPQDEIEELKAKYGASVVDTDALNRQNEYLNKIANGETVENQNQNVNHNQNIHQNIEQEPAVVRINADTHQELPMHMNVENPVNALFKGVKRIVDFNIELKLNNKIPRLDFIEMMEDSYESSIIDYLAEELTNNLLNNPSLIKDQISSKIRSMVAEVSKKVEVKEVEVKEVEKTPIEKKAPVKRTPRVSKKEKVIK